jgi:hypothetical protein
MAAERSRRGAPEGAHPTIGLTARWRSWAPYLLSVTRIVGAFAFLQFGTAKLLALPAAIMPGGGTAPLGSLPGVAGTLEMVGGRCCCWGCSPGQWLSCCPARWR